MSYKKGRGKMKTIFIMFVLLGFIGCTTPMPKKEIKTMPYHCDNVDRQIFYLQSEKEDNDKRIRSAARSIIPIGVIVGIVQWDYFLHLSVATGQWAKTVDNKIAEMSEYQRQCA